MTDLGDYVTVVGEAKDKQSNTLVKTSNQLGVKKHTAIIQSSNTLSLLQRKICNALLYHAYPNLSTQDEHEITVKDLCRLILYNGNNQSVIKEALAELVSTRVEWNIVEEGSKEEDWSASAVLADVNLKGGLCKYSYSNRMKKLLHNPTMFAKLNLYIQSHFRSSYGLALYENCTRYENLPHTRWFDMDTFRKLMGVSKEHYKIFRDFKRRVLDKAIEEVNSYSDLFIEAEFQKKGSTVTQLRFLIKFRNKKKRIGNIIEGNQSSTNQSSEILHQKLNTIFAENKKTIKSILGKYSENYIIEKINLIENTYYNKDGKIKNLPGLVMEALKSNFKDENVARQSRDKVKTPSSMDKPKNESKSNNLKRNTLNSRVLTIFNVQSPDYIEKHLTLFEETLGKSLYLELYKREGLNNILVLDQFVNYITRETSLVIDIQQNYVNDLEDVMS